eukprot:scaffold4937_cov261-Pinguiococcus_pyrenoidosus.AAC.4
MAALRRGSHLAAFTTGRRAVFGHLVHRDLCLLAAVHAAEPDLALLRAVPPDVLSLRGALDRVRTAAACEAVRYAANAVHGRPVQLLSLPGDPGDQVRRVWAQRRDRKADQQPKPPVAMRRSCRWPTRDPSSSCRCPMGSSLLAGYVERCIRDATRGLCQGLGAEGSGARWRKAVPDGSGVDSDEAAPPEAHHGHLRPDRSLEAVSGAASEEGGLLRALHRRHRRALPVHSGGGEALPHAAERFAQAHPLVGSSRKRELYQVGPPEQRGGRARIPVWQHGSSPRFQAPCPRAAQPKPADEHDVDLGTLGTARSSAKAGAVVSERAALVILSGRADARRKRVPDLLRLLRQLVVVEKLSNVFRGVAGREEHAVVRLRAHHPDGALRVLQEVAHFHILIGLKKGEESDGVLPRYAAKHNHVVIPGVFAAAATVTAEVLIKKGVADLIPAFNAEVRVGRQVLGAEAHGFGAVEHLAVRLPTDQEVHQLLGRIVVRLNEPRSATIEAALHVLEHLRRTPGQDGTHHKETNPEALRRPILHQHLRVLENALKPREGRHAVEGKALR